MAWLVGSVSEINCFGSATLVQLHYFDFEFDKNNPQQLFKVISLQTDLEQRSKNFELRFEIQD